MECIEVRDTIIYIEPSIANQVQEKCKFNAKLYNFLCKTFPICGNYYTIITKFYNYRDGNYNNNKFSNVIYSYWYLSYSCF